MKNYSKISQAIGWNKAKSLIDNGTLQIIGSNYSQINNQGEFTLSENGKKLFKRRHTASKSMYDLIAYEKN